MTKCATVSAEPSKSDSSHLRVRHILQMRPDILTFSCPRQQGVAVAGGSSSILGSDFQVRGTCTRRGRPAHGSRAGATRPANRSAAMHARLRQDTGASV